MQGGEKAAGVKEKLVEMNTIQRFADARNCLEGKDGVKLMGAEAPAS